jgi:hypothetical protein
MRIKKLVFKHYHCENNKKEKKEKKVIQPYGFGALTRISPVAVPGSTTTSVPASLSA